MNKVSVIVQVDPAAKLEEVTSSCERMGLSEASVMPRLSLVSGRIEAARMNDLLKVPGVCSIERERKIQLPPRGSPVQ